MQGKAALQTVAVITIFVVLTSLFLHFSPNGFLPALSSTTTDAEQKLHPLQQIHPEHFQALNVWKTSHLDFNDIEGVPHVQEIVEEEVPDHLLSASQQAAKSNTQKTTAGTKSVDNNKNLRKAVTTTKNATSTSKPSTSKSKGKDTMVVDETDGRIHFRGSKPTSSSTNKPAATSKKTNPVAVKNQTTTNSEKKTSTKITPVSIAKVSLSSMKSNIQFKANDSTSNPNNKKKDSVIQLQNTFTQNMTAKGNTVGLNPSSKSSSTSSLKHVEKMLDCYNQTRCIQPELQLKKHYNVYYCKHVSYGVRFYYLAREGLLLHPMIHLVDNMDSADIIIYLPESAVWHKTECNQPQYWHKIIMLDEGDGQHIFRPSIIPPSKGGKGVIPDKSQISDGFLLNFKRSYVHRDNGKFGGYMNYAKDINVFPMTYTIADAYVRPEYLSYPKRDIQILCSLRGGDYDPVRLRVRQWVEEYGKARGLSNVVAGQVNSASRTVVSKQYFDQMYRSQVIVTSNPSHWEGDFRFCEALASGALIFIDHMYVPRPKPFIENKHVVYYSNMNKTDLFMKLDAIFVANSPSLPSPWLPSTVDPNKAISLPEKRKLAGAIAMSGYAHAMRFHRAANLMDYVFRTLHVKELAAAEGKENLLLTSLEYARSVGGYKDHGYVLRLQVLDRQAKLNKRRNVNPSSGKRRG